LSGRDRPLDVFRGATVALMILVNNPGSTGHVYEPLDHAPWHGCTPTDLVFPFFLFAVGLSLALGMPAWQARVPALAWTRVLRRTALIFGLGLLVNASPFVRWDAAGELVLRSWDTLRVMGVLQRIALAFGGAALIVRLAGPRHVPWAAAWLLVGYWAACRLLGDGADPYSLAGWFGTAVDRALLGERHLYHGEGVAFDPEGLASTAPAVAQVLLGVWAGGIAARSRHAAERVAGLLRWAVVLLAAGWLWQLEMPLNKKLWTSSYVLHTAALAMMALALCIHAIEVRQRPPELRGWVRFCEVFGRNPLFVFVLSSLLPRLLALARWQDGVAADGTPRWTSPWPWMYDHLFAGLASDPRLGSLLQACAEVALYGLLAWGLDRRRLYIRV
jgi:predicted acyltransferase